MVNTLVPSLRADKLRRESSLTSCISYAHVEYSITATSRLKVDTQLWGRPGAGFAIGVVPSKLEFCFSPRIDTSWVYRSDWEERSVYYVSVWHIALRRLFFSDTRAAIVRQSVVCQVYVNTCSDILHVRRWRTVNMPVRKQGKFTSCRLLVVLWLQ